MTQLEELTKFDFKCGCIGRVYADYTIRLDPPCQKHADQVWNLAKFCSDFNKQNSRGVKQ